MAPTPPPTFLTAPTEAVTSPAPTQAVTSPAPTSTVIASKVKIQSTTGNVIQLNEVQVISGGVNIAIGKTATQGSTYRNKAKFVASNTIDGDMATFSHTKREEATGLRLTLVLLMESRMWCYTTVLARTMMLLVASAVSLMPQSRS